jgi:hypothetical protein
MRGSVAVEAVVVTVSMTFTGLVPTMGVCDGEIEQVEFMGAPEQVSVTAALHPPSGVICNASLAAFPAVTVIALVDALIEKSMPLPMSVTVWVVPATFPELSVTFSVADSEPVPEGVKVT